MLLDEPIVLEVGPVASSIEAVQGGVAVPLGDWAVAGVRAPLLVLGPCICRLGFAKGLQGCWCCGSERG